ncbi:MAG TPA: SDR family NAD(P)-dependent oxidoreductase, partial [Anaerolineales bacterium]|nr:SDR family NAD(P)-dependent oxidoreductase [Anaerolineales bacterium]
MTIQEKFDLTGRVAVVTGGVGLLGAEFCKTLAEAGAAVAVVDLNASALQTVAESLTKSGYQALALSTDITRPDSVNAAVENVLSTFGRLDVLVNSAALDPKFDPDAVNKGITPGAFEDYPLDLWNSALNVNLTGMFLMTQACVKPMIAQGKKGSVINICSTYGLNGPDQR